MVNSHWLNKGRFRLVFSGLKIRGRKHEGSSPSPGIRFKIEQNHAPCVRDEPGVPQ